MKETHRWSMNRTNKYRAWSIELIENKVAESINYLSSKYLQIW